MADSGRQVAAGRFQLVRPGAWSLWSYSGRVVGYVLAVELTAAGLVVLSLSSTGIPGDDLPPFAILLACCVVFGEASRRVERLHRMHPRTPHVDLNSVWMFAGILLLHPALTTVLIAVFHLHRWTRVAHRAAHRVTFSVAAGICSAVAATGVLAAGGHFHGFAGIPHDEVGLAVIGLAAGAQLVIQCGLVAAVIAMATPIPSPRAALGEWSDYGLEAATLTLGTLLAWTIVDWPVLAVPIVGVTLVLHRNVLIRHLREAASTDAKTGLLNAAGWQLAAERALGRRTRSGVLIIDLDHFKRVNDEYGHLAGDEVLVAVAEAILAQTRGYDLVGRFGGEEFVVLLPDTDAAELVRIADRIRREIAGLALAVTGHRGLALFRGLTASVGVAVIPEHATQLDELLRAADGALYVAKSAGRNQSRLAAPAEGSRR